VEINPETVPHQDVYKLLIGTVVPRPIAWVSTLNRDGQRNLAPFSFFNVVCSQPPTLVFCPLIRVTDGNEKDTLRNIRETGEFVINVVTEANLGLANISSTEFPAEVDEFVAANATAVSSVVVKPPRVGESPVAFECKLNQIVTISDQPGGGSLVIGTIVHIYVSDEILRPSYKIDPDALRAVGRMAGAYYARITDNFQLERPTSQIKPKVDINS